LSTDSLLSFTLRTLWWTTDSPPNGASVPLPLLGRSQSAGFKSLSALVDSDDEWGWHVITDLLHSFTVSREKSTADVECFCLLYPDVLRFFPCAMVVLNILNQESLRKASWHL
jgi:hypothetical protein